MKPVFLALALLTACTSDSTEIDLARCDAPRTYRIDRVELPASSAELRELVIDLDDNGVSDNALGVTSVTLSRLFEDVPLDLHARATAHLATDTAWRIAIADCSGGPGVAVGHDTIDLPGTVVDGRIEGTGSSGFVPLVALFDGTGDAGSIVAAAEQTKVALVETDGELTGTLGFAIPGEVAGPQVIHGMARFIDEHFDLGRADLDLDNDGTITEAELAASSTAQSLLGTDLVIDNIDAISLGVRIHGAIE